MTRLETITGTAITTAIEKELGAVLVEIATIEIRRILVERESDLVAIVKTAVANAMIKLFEEGQ